MKDLIERDKNAETAGGSGQDKRSWWLGKRKSANSLSLESRGSWRLGTPCFGPQFSQSARKLARASFLSGEFRTWVPRGNSEDAALACEPWTGKRV